MDAVQEAPAPGKHVGVREAARQLGVNASTVSRQVAAGIIPNHGTVAAPLIDVDEARRSRDDNLDRSRLRGAGTPLGLPFDVAAAGIDGDAATDGVPDADKISFQRVRTEREGFAAKRAQLDYEREIGLLLDKGEAADAVFAIFANVRETMTRDLPAIALRLGLTPEQTATLGEEFRKLQVSMADGLQRLASDERDAAA